MGVPQFFLCTSECKRFFFTDFLTYNFSPKFSRYNFFIQTFFPVVLRLRIFHPNFFATIAHFFHTFSTNDFKSQFFRKKRRKNLLVVLYSDITGRKIFKISSYFSSYLRENQIQLCKFKNDVIIK